eukprot:COSAG06_NODE_27267_length_596_cov_1.507042_1_plen_198_part_11
MMTNHPQFRGWWEQLLLEWTGDVQYVEELQELILARLERVGPRECEHASCSRAPYWGSAEDRQKRWCQAHRGDDSVCLHRNKMCEHCGEKEASFSMADKKRRWCGDCKPSGSAHHKKRQLCEECGAKGANYGMAGENRRWCVSCKHEGAVIFEKKCEDCGETRPTWGMPSAKPQRWCAGCAKADHPGAVDKYPRKKCE